MREEIIFCGQPAIVSCDENCDKAWGMQNRPRNGDDEIPDNELGLAPINPGTYEGGEAKPINKAGIPNKWCIRECERCTMTRPSLGSNSVFDTPPFLELFEKYYSSDSVDNWVIETGNTDLDKKVNTDVYRNVMAYFLGVTPDMAGNYLNNIAEYKKTMLKNSL